MDAATALGIASLLLAGAGWRLWVRALRRVAIPRDRRGYLAVMLVSVALAFAAFGEGPGWVGAAAAGLGGLAAAFFLATVAVSRQKGGPGAFETGQPLPDFEALGESGEVLRLSSLRGDRPLLLKFFRGHW